MHLCILCLSHCCLMNVSYKVFYFAKLSSNLIHPPNKIQNPKQSISYSISVYQYLIHMLKGLTWFVDTQTKFCADMAKILPSNMWSAFCHNHAWFSMWKTAPRELITEVTIWEWLMNKAEISCFLSGALKQMSHSGNFLLSINGKAQLATEKWLWVSCRETEREREHAKLMESLWVCAILKKLWRWTMTGPIDSLLLISMSYGNLFCHSVMYISLGCHKHPMQLQ